MKLRIKGNSVRLRLTRPEVASVAADGTLESLTDFGAGVLRYALVAKEDAQCLSSSFAGGSLVVTAPKSALSKWAEGNEVGLYGEQPTSDGQLLTIAVEKDFRCLDRSRAEADEADAYPHPIIKAKKI